MMGGEAGAMLAVRFDMHTARTPQAASYGSIVDMIAAWLVDHFDLGDCWFEPFPFDAQLPRIERGRIVLPAAEPGVAPWQFDNGVELPVRVHGLTLGRFILLPSTSTCGAKLSPHDRAEALAAVDRLAPSIAAAIPLWEGA